MSKLGISIMFEEILRGRHENLVLLWSVVIPFTLLLVTLVPFWIRLWRKNSGQKETPEGNTAQQSFSNTAGQNKRLTTGTSVKENNVVVPTPVDAEEDILSNEKDKSSVAKQAIHAERNNKTRTEQTPYGHHPTDTNTPTASRDLEVLVTDKYEMTEREQMLRNELKRKIATFVGLEGDEVDSGQSLNSLVDNLTRVNEAPFTVQCSVNMHPNLIKVVKVCARTALRRRRSAENDLQLAMWVEHELDFYLGQGWCCIAPIRPAHEMANLRESTTPGWPRNHSHLHKHYICFTIGDRQLEVFKIRAHN